MQWVMDAEPSSIFKTFFKRNTPTAFMAHSAVVEGYKNNNNYCYYYAYIFNSRLEAHVQRNTHITIINKTMMTKRTEYTIEALLA